MCAFIDATLSQMLTTLHCGALAASQERVSLEQLQNALLAQQDYVITSVL